MGGAARLVIDTSAYVHFRGGHAELLDLMAAAEMLTIPTIVIGELHAGFALGQRSRENRRVLAEFLAEAFVEVVPVTAEVAHRYGELFAALRRPGTPIPTNDIWIAACALSVGGHVVTFDRDFARIAGLPHTILEA